jgi:hypothetical protein
VDEHQPPDSSMTRHDRALLQVSRLSAPRSIRDLGRPIVTRGFVSRVRSTSSSSPNDWTTNDTKHTNEERVRMEAVDPEQIDQIMGACFEVDNEQGCRFLEPVYHECLMPELGMRGIPFRSKHESSVNLSSIRVIRLIRGSHALLLSAPAGIDRSTSTKTVGRG